MVDGRQDDTRGALIDAAEQVFARDGFERASLREIMRVAGANPAAVHYHFGGKDGLLEAVLERVVEPITVRRLELLDALRLATGDRPIATRRLVEAFLRPDFESIASLHARGAGRAALVGRAYGQPDDLVRRIVGRQFDPVAEAFFPEFERSAPRVPIDELRWRLRWGVVGVIIALFSNADAGGGPIDHDDWEPSLERTVDFVTAGLLAPSTPT